MKVKKFSEKLSVLLLLIFFNGQIIYADSIEKIGNVFWILLPSTAYGTTFIIEDEAGRNQFYKSFATTLVTTYALKYAVNKERPNGGEHSFPSYHTSSAFQSAAFIQMRYGWDYGLAAYAAASFVGYSRVHSDAHYTVDVVAGALIGILSSYYFTTPYENITITPQVNKELTGLFIQYRW